MEGRCFRQQPAQYSPSYHLSRPVKCLGCGLLVHKDRAFLANGCYCSQCRPQGVGEHRFGGALLR